MKISVYLCANWILFSSYTASYNNTGFFITIFRQCTYLRVLNVDNVLFATINKVIQAIVGYLKYICVLKFVTYCMSKYKKMY